MKKFIRIVNLLVIIVLAFIWGVAYARYYVFPYKLVDKFTSVFEEDKAFEVGTSSGGVHIRSTSDFNAIKSLPYLSWSNAKAKDGHENVVLHDRDKAWQGLNLYTSGHEDSAFLTDMDGSTVHMWNYPREDIWWDADEKKRDKYIGFRIAHAFKNLDLLAVYDYMGLIKLDKNSKLIWLYRGGCHHDLWVNSEGDIYVISHEDKLFPELNEKAPVIDDRITILDASGKEKDSHSILEIILNSEYAFLLPSINQISEPVKIDILHTNSIQAFDGKLEQKSRGLFKKGNILISVRNISCLFIIDPDDWRIVWAWGPTNISYQHKARLLDNGNILLFNNGTKRSSVLEIDPLAREIPWQYRGDANNPFFSGIYGAAQLLPNGNYLVTPSNIGESFEIDRNHRIVWRFINPQAKDSKVAVIYDMFRYDKNYFEGL